MPTMCCRDTDEACDWFFRDEDYLRLLATGTDHTLSTHPEVVKPLLEKVYAGEANWSELIPSKFGHVRMDD